MKICLNQQQREGGLHVAPAADNRPKVLLFDDLFIIKSCIYELMQYLIKLSKIALPFNILLNNWWKIVKYKN